MKRKATSSVEDSVDKKTKLDVEDVEDVKVVYNVKVYRVDSGAYEQSREFKKQQNLQGYFTSLQKSFDEDYPPAIHEMAYVYTRNNPLYPRINPNTLSKKLQILKKENDYDAFFYLGLLAEQKSYKNAITLIRTAAQHGNEKGQYQYGRFFEYGYLTLAIDYAQARYWYELAAEYGVPEAIFKLGVLYHKGRGVERDMTRALEYYASAAQKGQANAMYNIGHYHLQYSKLEPENKLHREKTLEFMQSAALKNHGRAQFHMGRFCIVGEYAKQDLRAAEKHMRSAYRNKIQAALIPLTEIVNLNEVESTLDRQLEGVGALEELLDYADIVDLLAVYEPLPKPKTPNEIAK